MIKLIAILIMLGVESLIIYFSFLIQKEKYNRDIVDRDKTLSHLTEIIKQKNIKIKELQDELKRKNNKRL